MLKHINTYCRLLQFISIFLFSSFFLSCKKYLEKKPNDQYVVPSSLADLQAILNQPLLNSASPAELDLGTDEYYLTTNTWQSGSLLEQKSYIWDKYAEITNVDSWRFPYQAIYTANLVLDILPTVSVNNDNKESYNIVKGTALFYRSFHFHQLAQLFCRPYSNTAATDPGIPLRLTAPVTNASTRASVQQCYDQIIEDIKSAIPLLPITTQYVTHPNRAAGYGLLARVYLSMADYTNAGKYADSCLNIYNKLINYQQLNFSVSPTASVFPFVLDNPEILFLTIGIPFTNAQASRSQLIDSLLYNSYNPNDLRRKAFFSPGFNANTFTYRGSYANYNVSFTCFHGIATDEIFLISAECKARANDVTGAMKDLTTLMRNRYITGTYTDTTSNNQNDALNKILQARKKELVFRGVRFSDLRRFNLEGQNITLTRIVNGVTYTLPPNDLRWVLLIPTEVEINRSGIQQNPR